MGVLDPRWYVRGSNERHEYDRKVPMMVRGTSFCQTCIAVHADPVGRDWHIESEDVDHMLCGLIIGLDEGEVRRTPGKNICRRCTAVLEEAVG